MRQGGRAQQKEQQHALLILKSIADWGRYTVAGTPTRGGGASVAAGDKVLKAIDEFGKQLEFQMSWLCSAPNEA